MSNQNIQKKRILQNQRENVQVILKWICYQAIVSAYKHWLIHQVCQMNSLLPWSTFSWVCWVSQRLYMYLPYLLKIPLTTAEALLYFTNVKYFEIHWNTLHLFVYTFYLALLVCGLSILTTYGIHFLANLELWSIGLLAALLILFVTIILVIWRQPQSQQKVAFMVREG